ncbi:unnamed protein product [Brassicogethes aeneus]|uniref:Uncharacterized protein n=1 Tax=Brassicogethes aeneus TaxID=1431903 RepID=A0A9P0FP59_BRAAE|nr:unnamed protein product [Brassicogethes aeneus]
MDIAYQTVSAKSSKFGVVVDGVHNPKTLKSLTRQVLNEKCSVEDIAKVELPRTLVQDIFRNRMLDFILGFPLVASFLLRDLFGPITDCWREDAVKCFWGYRDNRVEIQRIIISILPNDMDFCVHYKYYDTSIRRICNLCMRKECIRKFADFRINEYVTQHTSKEVEDLVDIFLHNKSWCVSCTRRLLFVLVPTNDCHMTKIVDGNLTDCLEDGMSVSTVSLYSSEDSTDEDGMSVSTVSLDSSGDSTDTDKLFVSNNVSFRGITYKENIRKKTPLIIINVPPSWANHTKTKYPVGKNDFKIRKLINNNGSLENEPFEWFDAVCKVEYVKDLQKAKEICDKETYTSNLEITDQECNNENRKKKRKIIKRLPFDSDSSDGNVPLVRGQNLIRKKISSEPLNFILKNTHENDTCLSENRRQFSSSPNYHKRFSKQNSESNTTVSRLALFSNQTPSSSNPGLRQVSSGSSQISNEKLPCDGTKQLEEVDALIAEPTIINELVNFLYLAGGTNAHKRVYLAMNKLFAKELALQEEKKSLLQYKTVSS